MATGLLLAQDPQVAAPPKAENPDEPGIPTKDYAQTYRQPFKGSSARPEGWKFTSRASEQLVQFEPEGLRLTLPPGGPERGQAAGIVTDFGVKGDFEITLSFEIFKEPEPADVGKTGTRLSLAITLDSPLLDTPRSEVATMSRSMGTKGERVFVTWMRQRGRPAPVSNSYPAATKTGRLRLVRSGDELFYLASAGLDAPFVFLRKYRFGADDLKRVVITSATGSDKATLDARVTDFQIRADAIPDAPRPEAAAETPPTLASTPRDGARGWLLASLALALVLVGAFAAALILRKRGRARRNGTQAAPVSLSFACAKCARTLKTGAEMAGKKVKCSHCGATMRVPANEADEARGASTVK